MINSTDPVEPLQGHVRQGVTLVEVIMVIIVLSVSAMIVPIGFDGQWNAERQLSADTSNMRQSLRLARDSAILHQASTTVSLDRSGDQRLLVQQSATASSPAKTWEVWLDTDTDIRFSNASITFTPNGLADRNLEVRMSQDQSRASLTVSVTGQVQ